MIRKVSFSVIVTLVACVAPTNGGSEAGAVRGAFIESLAGHEVEVEFLSVADVEGDVLAWVGSSVLPAGLLTRGAEVERQLPSGSLEPVPGAQVVASVAYAESDGAVDEPVPISPSGHFHFRPARSSHPVTGVTLVVSAPGFEPVSRHFNATLGQLPLLDPLSVVRRTIRTYRLLNVRDLRAVLRPALMAGDGTTSPGSAQEDAVDHPAWAMLGLGSQFELVRISNKMLSTSRNASTAVVPFREERMRLTLVGLELDHAIVLVERTTMTLDGSGSAKDTRTAPPHRVRVSFRSLRPRRPLEVVQCAAGSFECERSSHQAKDLETTTWWGWDIPVRVKEVVTLSVDGMPRGALMTTQLVRAQVNGRTFDGQLTHSPEAAATLEPPPILPSADPATWTGERATTGHVRQALVVVVDRYPTRAWDLTDADKAVDRLRTGLATGLGIASEQLVVVRGERATKVVLGRELRNLGQRLRGMNNLLLVYVYTHGFVQDGELHLFTADTELEGQRFVNTLSHSELGGLYARTRAAAREHGADVQIVSVVDACRVKTLAPPGPPRYVPLEDVAEVFSAKVGQFATEGVFTPPFCEALVDSARRDRTTLGDVFDATRAAVEAQRHEQTPELAQGGRDLVLRDVANLSFGVEAWDGVGGGKPLGGATVILGERRVRSPGGFDRLRPGRYAVRVEHDGYLARTVHVELAAAQSGKVLRVPLLPALVLVVGHTTARGNVRVALTGARPAGTVDGYHALNATPDAEGRFVLRLPPLVPSATVELEVDGEVVARAAIPAATAEEVHGDVRVPRHDVGRLVP